MPGAEKPKGIQLQPRDFELLRDLFESRVMTLSHITALHFDGHREAAKKRIARLKRAGLLRERPRRSNEPAIHFLGRNAIQLLQQHGQLAGYPHLTETQLERRLRVSDLTLRHELEVMDVKAAMIWAMSKTERFSVLEFSTWPRLHEFQACRGDGRKVLVKPDGFAEVREWKVDGRFAKHVFFIEVDRSTEAIDIIADRCQCYLNHYRSGGFAVRSGGTREQCKAFPFRVLVICKSEERQHRISESLLRINPPTGAQIWFTNTSHFFREPLGDRWTIPLDQKIGKNSMRSLFRINKGS